MTPFVVVLIIVILFGFFIISRLSARSGQEDNAAPPQPVEINWDALDDAEVQAALAKGNKIEAIKRYRILTGLGLKESKDAIEYANRHPDERGAKKKQAAYDAQDAGIRDLILDGHMDEAIKVYQKFAGVDEYTARDAVDAIARDLHLTNQSASRTTFEAPSTDQSNRN